MNRAEGRLSWSRILIALVLTLLLLLTAGNLWLYLQGSQALESQIKAQSSVQLNHSGSKDSLAGLIKNFNDWSHTMTLTSFVGGVGLLLAAALGIVFLRSRWQNHALTAARRADELSRQLDSLRNGSSRYKAEKNRLEEELRLAYDEMEKRIQQRTDELSRTCQALERELSSKRMAEKALTYQAKELERSKDVLELHVQARTQELQKLKSRYELILNSAGEGIYGLDLQGRMTFVNPAAAKLTGWDIEEMIGRSEKEIFYGLDPAVEQEAEEAVQKDRDGHHLCDQVFQRKDGTKFHAEYVRTVISEEGRLFGAVVIFKDITERKRTDQALAAKAAELARSNSELEQFAYVASHDLQEPLRKIQAFGDRLKRKCEAVDLKEGRDYLDRMLRAAARMQTLINDLLTFSRVISNSHPFMPVNLNDITREVLSDLEVRIEQTKAKVILGELPTIDADPTQMRQLLQNLISNALKFSKPGQPPEVIIDATLIPSHGPGGEYCELRIQDNGIGFEERYIDKIFAVFQRLHGRSEYEGTGVGLAVCRRITDRHGGTIAAQSQLGQGATFIVNLPVHQHVLEAAA